ncbi:tRNA (guanosine(18)-2'-O)-methyltransferase TrmH [Marinobacter sp. V034]|uniref:tRNA (guanosine(18)-2'-O)-methyltransferase TrmH n=1 Tax=Marinobacter sp. V034 TaxID=3459610 RepID=UPI00404478EB
MTPERLARIKGTLDRRQPDLRVLTDQIHKPRNVSAIIRSCDAFGVANMHAVWPREGYRAFRKTTGGSHHWVTTYTHPDMMSAIGDLRQSGHAIYAAQFSDRAVDYRDVDFTRPCVLVLGNEVGGVSQSAADAADEHVVVPMMGMVESLNVSAACAIILAEAQRQRSEAGMFEVSRMPPEEYNRLLFRWCQPQITRYCDDRRLPYPPFDPDTGDLVDGVNWMAGVREIRKNRQRKSAADFPDPGLVTGE